MQHKNNVTMIEDLEDLDDYEEKYKKFIRKSSKIPMSESGMKSASYYDNQEYGNFQTNFNNRHDQRHLHHRDQLDSHDGHGHDGHGQLDRHGHGHDGHGHDGHGHDGHGYDGHDGHGHGHDGHGHGHDGHGHDQLDRYDNRYDNNSLNVYKNSNNNNYPSCLKIHEHVLSCPICSTFFNPNTTLYIISIIILFIICILLLKKVMNF
jgi:hypothetical protein